MVKVAIVQFKASTSKDANLQKILKYISQAAKKGAKLIAFPEFMMFYTSSSQTPSQLANQAESINGNFIKTITKSAKEKARERLDAVSDIQFDSCRAGAHLFELLKRPAIRAGLLPFFTLNIRGVVRGYFCHAKAFTVAI